MRRTLTAAAAAALALGLVAGPAAAGPPERTSIVDAAIAINADSGEFDELIAAVSVAGLVETLDGKRQFTVFAPTDEAFGDLAEDLGVTDANENGLVADDLVEALGIETVTAVLLYHVAPGERDSTDVVSSTQVRTLSKEFIPIGTDDGVIGNAGPVLLDQFVSNGVIHVIDAVLLPPSLG